MAYPPSHPAACVVGHPVAHARSPIIHGHWLRSLRIDGDYRREDVRPQDLGAFLSSLEARGYVGCNLTIPHKEAAIPFLSGMTERARRVGAVNTIWLEQDGPHGDNTDVEGFLAHLDATTPGWAAKATRAVTLGAGGAARAIVAALAERGFARIDVVNRSESRAGALAADFPNAVGHGWAALGSLLAGADLLVNATSLGMRGQPPLDIDLAPLPAEAIVSDIVYAPLRTPLLESAERRGLRAVDGLGMLLHQAVPGFARWFGARPAVTQTLRELVIADIARGS